jgi:hypothetical protein
LLSSHANSASLFAAKSLPDVTRISFVTPSDEMHAKT